MVDNVVPLGVQLYTAKSFTVETDVGTFKTSGTLCGNLDLATPNGTWCLTPDEMQNLIVALTNARQDVLSNSRPFSDPRLKG